MRTDLTTEITTTRSELNTAIEALRSDMREDFAAARDERAAINRTVGNLTNNVAYLNGRNDHANADSAN
ncbi:MAG: hypothetical protein F4103_13220 [Boseongicola sp. SB0673_bin_14]|nr:hypothetical protein [Boseongicola sp. SB0673_bin_14]